MITAKLYTNGDDCFLAWSMPPTPDCWGFAIWRELKTAGGKVFNGYIHNRTGFEGENNPPNSHKPSTEWPFQRYNWTDHGVDEGDEVSYIIYPVLKSENGLEADKNTFAKLGPVKVTASGEGKSSAYFNRGILLSQFMIRYLPKNWTKSDLFKLKKSLESDDSELRIFLSGQLGHKLAELLDEAKKKKWLVYAALYELDDNELIQRLKALGKKAHIVLANGSNKKKGEDGNKDAADKLKGSVNLYRRMLWSEGLGHNKFLVFAKTASSPFLVWTGSTNWATTGLCTQLNNGILVEDKELAAVFKKQWQLLKDDVRIGKAGKKMHFGDDLMDSNDTPKNGGKTHAGKWTVWFTRTRQAQDVKAVAELINGAKEAILFLMFEPGNNGLLQVIQSRLSPASKTYNKDLYIHGVVNTLKPIAKGEDVEVELVGRGSNKPFGLKVVQPEGVKNLAGWADEVMRDDFIMGKGGVIGHAIIHSKTIVIDPFTNPVVITGSHNFSVSASTKNDENILIFGGNKELAQKYIVNIMSNYQHYRWRAYLQECKKKKIEPWAGLKKSGEWQNKFQEKDRELQFWVKQA